MDCWGRFDLRHDVSVTAIGLPIRPGVVVLGGSMGRHIWQSHGSCLGYRNIGVQNLSGVF